MVGGVLFFFQISKKFDKDFDFLEDKKEPDFFSFPLKKPIFSAKKTPKFSPALRAD